MKVLLIFCKNFLDFGLDTVEKHGNLSCDNSKSYASTVLHDSKAVFLGEGKVTIFRFISLLCFVYRLHCIFREVCYQIFLSSKLQLIFC